MLKAPWSIATMRNVGHLAPGRCSGYRWARHRPFREMPRQERGLMWGFQLWVNLPAAQKMTAPRYQDIPPERIPEVEIPGGSVRVVAGEAGGVRGAVSGIATDPVYLDVRLQAGGELRHALPAEHNAFVYVYEGTAHRRRRRARGAARPAGGAGTDTCTRKSAVVPGAPAAGGGPAARQPIARYARS
jgi:redox-sensitive bicupin YhaK (pirin superfamily)